MQKLIVSTFYLLALFIPLTFTTLNHELFEFPKFIILLSGTSIVTLAWLIHALKTKDYQFFHRSLISYSVLAILLTQILATLFSLHPYTSFWGYYSRFHGGLLTTICYTILYFSALKWLDKKSTLNIIKISVITSILISLYAILERLGINKDFWIQDVQNRVFATLGQPNWLAAYLLPNIFLTLYLGHIHKQYSRYSIFLFSILLTALLFTRSRSGFIAFILSYLTYWILLARQISFSKLKHSLYRYSLFLFSILAIFGTPYTPSFSSLLNAGAQDNRTTQAPSGTVLDNGGTESGDIRKIVWTGAVELIKQHPLLGTGPETFAYTYYWTRPISHNLTSEWDFLYNKAHNEYLNIGANTGLLGLLGYLTWHATSFLASLTTIPKSKKIQQENEDLLRHFSPVLGAGLVGFTITNFFGFSVIPVFFLTLLLCVIPATLSKSKPPSSPQPTPIEALVLLLPLIYIANIFLADVNYAKGKRYLDAGQIPNAVKYLDLAVTKRPGLDLYHATLAEAYATIGQLDNALKHVNINQTLNPHHLNFYKSRAKTYLTLATIDGSYHHQALNELARSRELAPTDPKLAYNLALVYTRVDQIDLAQQNLLDAIALKPNYPEPYYALTLLYEQTKQVDKIPDILSQAESNLATYSPQLKEKIDKYQSRPNQ